MYTTFIIYVMFLEIIWYIGIMLPPSLTCQHTFPPATLNKSISNFRNSLCKCGTLYVILIKKVIK
jgi:hypothetical protein